MAIGVTKVASDFAVLSDLIKHEYKPEWGYCRTNVTYNGAALTLAQGTLLGKITATGKYIVVDKDASDGSQVVAAVVLQETVAPATTDTSVLVAFRGPMGVLKTGLVAGDTVSATVNTQLESLGIQVIREYV